MTIPNRRSTARSIAAVVCEVWIQLLEIVLQRFPFCDFLYKLDITARSQAINISYDLVGMALVHMGKPLLRHFTAAARANACERHLLQETGSFSAIVFPRH